MQALALCSPLRDALDGREHAARADDDVTPPRLAPQGAGVDRTRETESNARGYLKYDYFSTAKSFGYSNATFERDRLKGLNLGSALGVGRGYQFLEGSPTSLSLEGGLTCVNEDFRDAADNRFPGLRWGRGSLCCEPCRRAVIQFFNESATRNYDALYSSWGCAGCGPGVRLECAADWGGSLRALPAPGSYLQSRGEALI